MIAPRMISMRAYRWIAFGIPAILALVVGVLAITAVSARAQEYAPPDRELWDAMAKALGDISMPLPAHQRAQQIMADVQREAALRQARAKADAAKPKVD